METNQEMSYLLRILPSTLKNQLAKFLYNEAIHLHRLLQNRDETFYGRFLEDLKHDKIIKGDFIVKKGNPVDFVFFIMTGIAKNVDT